MLQDWKRSLDSFYSAQNQQKVEHMETKQMNGAKAAEFYNMVVAPAFKELKQALEERGRQVEVSIHDSFGSIRATFETYTEADYSIVVTGLHPVPRTRSFDWSDGKYFGGEGFLRSGTQDYTVSDLTKDEIIQDFLEYYKRKGVSRNWFSVRFGAAAGYNTETPRENNSK